MKIFQAKRSKKVSCKRSEGQDKRQEKKRRGRHRAAEQPAPESQEQEREHTAADKTMPPMTASAHRQAWQKLAASSTLRNIVAPRLRSTAVFQRAASSSSSSSSFSSFSSSTSRRLWSQQQPTFRRSYSSGAPPPPNNNQIKFWPFVVVIALGSGGYVLLANTRKGA